MTNYPGHQVVYQCDHQLAKSMKQHKDKTHHALKDMVNRKVRIQTVDDEVYEGTIMKVDFKFLYLNIEIGESRGFFPGFYPPRPPFYPPFNPFYSNVVLPLALFDLLAISLLL